MNKDNLRPAPRQRKPPRVDAPRIEDLEHQEDFILLNMVLFVMLIGQAAEAVWKAVTLRYGK